MALCEQRNAPNPHRTDGGPKAIFALQVHCAHAHEDRSHREEREVDQVSEAAANGGPFTKDTYLRWFKEMMLMRRFEEKCGQLYTMQKFGGFCHLYIGQEAILAGTIHSDPNE